VFSPLFPLFLQRLNFSRPICVLDWLCASMFQFHL
jgi:hypothetical protein